EPPVVPPVAGMPEDFSRIVGAYRIQAEANPTEVEVEQPIVLKVTVHGKGPAAWQPAQENLKIFPASAANDFFIEPVPDLKRIMPEKGVWEFVYRLRPKSTDVTAIPSLKLAFFNNQGRPRFQDSYADPIPITVKPAQPKDIDLKLDVLSAPAYFFETRSAASG